LRARLYGYSSAGKQKFCGEKTKKFLTDRDSQRTIFWLYYVGKMGSERVECTRNKTGPARTAIVAIKKSLCTNKATKSYHHIVFQEGKTYSAEPMLTLQK
jgi:hypothetical protein